MSSAVILHPVRVIDSSVFGRERVGLLRQQMCVVCQKAAFVRWNRRSATGGIRPRQIADAVSAGVDASWQGDSGLQWWLVLHEHALAVVLGRIVLIVDGNNRSLGGFLENCMLGRTETKGNMPVSNGK